MSVVITLGGFGAVFLLCGASWAIWGVCSLPLKSGRMYTRVLVGFLHVAIGATAIVFPAKLYVLFAGYRQHLNLPDAREHMGVHLFPYAVACFLVTCAGLALVAAWPLGWRGPSMGERLSGVPIVAIGLCMHLYSSQWEPGNAISVNSLVGAPALLAVLAFGFVLKDAILGGGHPAQ